MCPISRDKDGDARVRVPGLTFKQLNCSKMMKLYFN